MVLLYPFPFYWRRVEKLARTGRKVGGEVTYGSGLAAAGPRSKGKYNVGGKGEEEMVGRSVYPTSSFRAR